MENNIFKTVSLVAAGMVLVVVGVALGRWLDSRDATVRVADFNKFGDCLRGFAGEINDKDGQKVIVVTAKGIEGCAAKMEYIEQVQ